ncbi:MAG: hypothetical protein IKJ73_09765 [Lachnospiraceae bacterium]|nr:hypothetical protein [Lachnospiraceae bacterium]
MRVYNPINTEQWIDLPADIEENYKLVMEKYGIYKNLNKCSLDENDDCDNNIRSSSNNNR